MKKTIALILSLMMLIFAAWTTVSAVTDEAERFAAPVLKGDTNGDTRIGAKDLSILKRIISGALEDEDGSADVNSDGFVNSRDLALMKQYIAGNIASFDNVTVGGARGGNAGNNDTPQEDIYISLKDEHPEFTRTGEIFSAELYDRAGYEVFEQYLSSYFGAPAGVIDNYEDYVDFCNNIPQILVRSSEIPNGDAHVFTDVYFALPDVSESFFDDSVLVIGHLFAPCCNYIFEVDGVSLTDDGMISVNVTEHIPQLGLDAIEEYAVLVAVNRSFAGSAVGAELNIKCEFESEY